MKDREFALYMRKSFDEFTKNCKISAKKVIYN